MRGSVAFFSTKTVSIIINWWFYDLNSFIVIYIYTYISIYIYTPQFINSSMISPRHPIRVFLFHRHHPICATQKTFAQRVQRPLRFLAIQRGESAKCLSLGFLLSSEAGIRDENRHFLQHLWQIVKKNLGKTVMRMMVGWRVLCFTFA